MAEKIQVIYKLNDINPEDGVDIFEVAPILMSFGELIRSANEVLGGREKIDVRVKPFREGSWISEFVLEQQGAIRGIFDYLNTADGQNLLNILQLLGIGAKDGIVSVINLIRFTKGKVRDYHEDKETGKFIYTNENGEKIEISQPVHRLTQSPFVQMNIYNVTASALEKFPTVGSISLQRIDSNEEIITEEDREYFEEYSKQELLTEVQVSELKEVFISPKRGSYSGEQKAYSFIFGESVLWPTAIEDEEFLAKLQSGEVRPFQADLIKVDLEIRQKRDSGNKIVNQYAIKKVHEYIEYKQPIQKKLL